MGSSDSVCNFGCHLDPGNPLEIAEPRQHNPRRFWRGRNALATRLDSSFKLAETWEREHELTASSSLETVRLGYACKELV